MSKSDPVLAKRKGMKVAVSDKSLMSSPTLSAICETDAMESTELALK